MKSGAAAGLARYRQMRDFSRTPEPRGRTAPRAKRRALSFYVQRHDARRLHYDFRLELDGVLKSWAVPKGPSLDPSVKRLAVEVEDHPLEYGEFEGAIPEQQYGAGEVRLWDQGSWTPLDDDPAAALRKGRLHFTLHGAKLRGDWVLARTRGDAGKPQWLLIKRDDEAARRGEPDVVVAQPDSVKAPPRRKARAAKSDVPEFIAPQLATLVSEPPTSGRWVYEVKHDGYRMVARCAGTNVRLLTRTGGDWTAKLPHLAQTLAKMKVGDSLLDGEIVVPKPDGRSDFQALQNAFERGADAAIVYFVFDAPFLDGKDLRPLPLAVRKQRLAAALAKNPQPSVRLSTHSDAPARELLARACEMGLEGLIGKDADSVYVSGRTRSWIKLKCRSRQDFVIGGYTSPAGSRTGFGALLVGVHDAGGALRYAGKVGTGYSEALLQRLAARLAALKTEKAPFADPPREKNVHWVQPKLVAEIAFAERTKDGVLRQASFVGLRQDLPAKAVHEEKPVAIDDTAAPDRVRGIRISNPQRPIWPELAITKLDLARYCDEVGDWLLPHVHDRPLSLVRCPDGVAGECFYQRHLPTGRAGEHLNALKREGAAGASYVYVSSLAGVISAVQNGAVEFHTWGASVAGVTRPDRITIDLDPDPALPWKQLLRATRLTKALLDGLQLASFLKTTGGKGLHVVVPLAPEKGWDEVKNFAQEIARFLARAEPDLFTSNMAKNRRGGKVFVDYLRNADRATAVAAYSPRARGGATVSTPLAWGELGTADPRGKFTLKTVPPRLARIGNDPWHDYARVRQSITEKMKKSLGS